VGVVSFALWEVPTCGLNVFKHIYTILNLRNNGKPEIAKIERGNLNSQIQNTANISLLKNIYFHRHLSLTKL
jgi:hypothetical protein